MTSPRDKKEFHPAYLESEQAFYAKIAPLQAKERELRKAIRANVAADDNTRMDGYREAYLELDAKAEDIRNEFLATTVNEIGELEKVLHESGSADHLIAASGLDADQRRELLDLALNTAQPGLAKALAQTARQRNEFGTYERWCNDDPQRAEALKKYRGIPNRERLLDRIYKATSIPKADFQALQPTAQDQQKAEAEARADDVRRQREQFYGLPKYGTKENPHRQVGRNRTPGHPSVV